jgi:uncharacterized protein YwbE
MGGRERKDVRPGLAVAVVLKQGQRRLRLTTAYSRRPLIITVDIPPLR